MKKMWFGLAAFLLLTSLAATQGVVQVFAQAKKTQDSSKPPIASVPANSGQSLFYCDRNNDGICDYCGRPAGSGAGWRAAGSSSGTAVQGRGLGPGQGYCRGNGRGRGVGRGCPWRQPVQSPQQQ
jgi:hypothetical protein